ncbi:MAG: hypothetical protein E6G44_04100 [Actinobacteria bacterium]|nr:MAG: hypothetical protein E6G44_04100 [Actinomycetota bacterium]
MLRLIERTVLGVGMTFVAWVIERRLIKALRKGRIEPAPRTAAEADELGVDESLEPGVQASGVGLTITPHQIGDQTDR